MRCAVCGGEAVIEGMCVNCYMERHTLFWIDDIIELVKCPKCERFNVEKTWKDIDFDSAVFEEITSRIRVHPSFNVEDVEINPLTSGEFGKYSVRLSGDVEGYDVEEEKIVEVRVKTRTCEKCTMISGGYYEAIVQIRADNRDIESFELEKVRDIIERILEREKDNKKAFVSKIVERKEGVDFYFGDKNLGRKVSREIVKALGGKIVESRKLHTRKDGRDLYRYTFAVRLPCYRIGDVVREGEKVCIVVERGKGINVENYGVVDLKNPEVVRRREELEKGVVVNYDDYVVEIASESGVIKAIKPCNLSLGEEVYFFEYDSRYYAIPPKIYEGR